MSKFNNFEKIMDKCKCQGNIEKVNALNDFNDGMIQRVVDLHWEKENDSSMYKRMITIWKKE